MKDFTQHKAILAYLQSVNGWVPGYLLSKAELLGVWVGSRGERSARDLVSEYCPKGLEGKTERMLGKHLRTEKGITIDFQGKPIEDRYVYYRSITDVEYLVMKSHE